MVTSVLDILLQNDRTSASTFGCITRDSATSSPAHIIVSANSIP